MIYHVLPGDSLVDEFKKAEIPGEVIVFRDAMIVGPVDAKTPDEFWDERARFILTEYAEDEIVFHERVADELEQLADVTEDDEINLWFEYELFCSVNMWFCLWKLRESGTTVFRVEPSVLSEKERWSGFAGLASDDLSKCFDAKLLLTDGDLKLGADLWRAFRDRNNERLKELSERESTRFPYLTEVCEAAIAIESSPEEILREIQSEGISEFDEMFPEFSKRAGVYGFGDSQVQRILDKMS